MRKVAGDLGAAADLADRLFIRQPIDSTIARTNRTAFEGSERHVDAAGKLAASPRLQICGPAHSPMLAGAPGRCNRQLASATCTKHALFTAGCTRTWRN